MVATLERKQTNGSEDHDGDSSEKPKRYRNPLMKGLEPAMFRTPYPLDFAEGLMSDELCYEKGAKFIFEALEFKTEKECIEFTKKCWHWMQQAEQRRIDHEVKNILARLGENPKVLSRLKEVIEESS